MCRQRVGVFVNKPRTETESIKLLNLITALHGANMH